jgi:lipopolysaccharide assembly protein A
MRFLEMLPRSQELERVEEGPQREDLSMQSFLIVALGLAILTVIFALQNTIPVGVTFLIWKFEGSLALVLMLTFALGVLVSFLVSIPAIVKRRSAISNQMKKIEELENRLRGRTPPFV